MTEKLTEELIPPRFKHFDSLIWQVPAWSSALFMLAIMGLQNITGKMNGPTNWLLLIFLFVVTFTHVALAIALFRFRVYQTKTIHGMNWTSPHPRIPFGAQTWLQMAVSAQVGCLGFFFFYNLSNELSWALVFSLAWSVVVLALTIIGERAIRNTRD